MGAGVAAVAISAGAIMPAAAASRPQSTALGAYVALGDSYTAAPLVPTIVNVGCVRSNHDYPSLVASALHPSALHDVSCSGATTADMTGSQSGVLGITEAPQFNALSSSTALVTLGISGNDIGFTNIITTCAERSVLNPFGSPCKSYFGTQLTARIAAAAPKVAAVLQGIHQRSPQARVFVVGYPDILPTSGNGCWPVVPIAHGDVAFLRGVEVSLNAMLASQSAANGARYVDTYTPSIGHDACQPSSRKWIEGIVPTHPAFPVHPNAAGEQGMAAAVTAAIG